MSLKERVYSVLVVSAAEKLNTALSELLSDPLFSPVKFVHSISAAKRAWNEQAYDFLIISSPLPDETGISFAVDIGSTRSAAVLLLIRSEIHDEIHERVVEQGVFTLRKPFTRNAFLTALQWMESARGILGRIAPDQQLILLLNKADAVPAAVAEEARKTLEKVVANSLRSRSAEFAPGGTDLSAPLLMIASAKGEQGLEALRRTIVEMYRTLVASAETTLVTNARHLQALQNASAALLRVRAGLSTLPSDLLAQDLRESLHHLGTITGAITPENVLSEIFSKFCIGK